MGKESIAETSNLIVGNNTTEETVNISLEEQYIDENGNWVKEINDSSGMTKKVVQMGTTYW